MILKLNIPIFLRGRRRWQRAAFSQQFSAHRGKFVHLPGCRWVVGRRDTIRHGRSFWLSYKSMIFLVLLTRCGRTVLLLPLLLRLLWLHCEHSCHFCSLPEVVCWREIGRGFFIAVNLAEMKTFPIKMVTNFKSRSRWDAFGLMLERVIVRICLKMKRMILRVNHLSFSIYRQLIFEKCDIWNIQRNIYRHKSFRQFELALIYLHIFIFLIFFI